MKTKHLWLCAIAFIHAVVLCSCGLENYRKDDFAKLEKKDFPVSMVVVKPTFSYGLSDVENIEPIFKMIPYDEIAAMLKKRCGIDVDTSDVRKKISQIQNWKELQGESVYFKDVIVETDRNLNTVYIMLDTRSYEWHEQKKDNRPLYDAVCWVDIYVAYNKASIYKQFSFRTETNAGSPYNKKDFINVIDGQYIKQDDKSHCNLVREKYLKKIENTLQNDFISWLYKQRTEEEVK